MGGVTPLLSPEEAKPSPLSPGAQSRLVSLCPQQAPLGLRWHHCRVCEPQRQESTEAATLPFWDLPEDWEYIWSSTLWRGTVLLKPLILPNTPTPKPTSPSPTPGCSRQLQVRVAAAETIERPVDLEAKAEVVYLGVVGGEEALDAPCAPPLPPPLPWVWDSTGDLGSGRHREAPQPQQPARQPGAGSLRGQAQQSRRPAGTQRRDSGSFPPPFHPTPSPRDGQRLPGRVLPFSADKEPGT